MRIPFVKSRQEREFERRVKYRRIVRGLQTHLKKLQQARERFRGLLRAALEVKNESAVQRNARACAALGKRIERVQGQVLAVEGIDAVGEMVRIDRDFAVFAREMGRAMTEAVGHADLARFEADLERGIMKAEELDVMLDDVLGTLSDSLVSFGAPAEDDEVEATVREAIAEAQDDKAQEQDLEARIAQELANIKETVEKS